ncbi:MAG TPA: acyl-CoA dehydrogenase family protein [Candidatus Acidoferrales bacterium]|nr:acyl-CoA dehydrogenase family protein [Candidatus Acidoferrales bacterium]
MVSFQPNEEQQLMRDTVAAFARDQIRPLARECDEKGEIPGSLIQQGWDLGLVHSAIPESYGGSGEARSAVTSALILEELAWGDLSVAMHMTAPRLLVYPVVDAGTDDQKERVLKRFTGAKFSAGTAAVMEPRFDFDLSELGATARLDNSSYVLNGSKCYVPLAADSDQLLVYASTNGSGYESVGGFLVDKDTPGLTITEREKNMGLKGVPTYEIALNNCRVSAANRLGGDKGCDFSRLMNHSRVALASMAVGVARASFEYARDYAKERRAFGMFIAQKQAIAFMLAEMALEIDAARLLTWEAAWKLDRGEDATREAYLAKNYAANMCLKVTDNGVQILGGHGYIRDHLVELLLRNGRGFAAFEGLAIA